LYHFSIGTGCTGLSYSNLYPVTYGTDKTEKWNKSTSEKRYIQVEVLLE
jgi:hypothetical protein